MKLLVGATSDAGRVREGNEDSFLVDDRLRLFAIADGMGGHRAGEVASAIALEALRASVAAGHPLDEAVYEANRAVYTKSADDQALSGMGTTLTAVAAGTDRAVVVGHVGDSRAYLVRGGQLDQITEDHSLVEEMVREGRLTHEQAQVHPQRSIITRAIGIDPEIDVDLYPVELEPGDRLLICSDGLSDMVRPPDIARILRREDDPQRASEALADAANANGGEDNVTAVVIAAFDDGDATRVGATIVEEEAVAPVAAPGARATVPLVPAAAPVPPPDTAAAAHALAESRALRRGRTRRLGRGAARLVWFVAPVLLILGVAVAATWWYARGTYYVGLQAGRVTVFRGRPGGFLGWEPTVQRRTGLPARTLGGAQLQDLRDGHQFSSADKADRFVDRLRASATTTTTATTAPAVVTTTSSSTTTLPQP